MIYNLLYIGDDNDTFNSFLSKTKDKFNVVKTDDIQYSLDIISTQTIHCIVAGTSKGINIISLLEEFKHKLPNISRILIISESEENAIDYIYDYDVINRIDVMFALNEPYNDEHLKEVLRTACLANGSDKRALFYSVVETVSNKLENKSLLKQVQRQEETLKEYIDELFAAKEEALKAKDEALKAKDGAIKSRLIRFKATRLAWNSTIIVRAIFFAVVSGIVGAYKSELTQTFIKIVSMNHE